MSKYPEPCYLINMIKMRWTDLRQGIPIEGPFYCPICGKKALYIETIKAPPYEEIWERCSNCGYSRMLHSWVKYPQHMMKRPP
ncbi:hypothetical protein DRN84_02645 [Candidatus Geothermarchaeota archaeon]|nr:MAG: hypothetical protein DRN84_02645 [Candidatus Geothermarchaeota archaeon]